MALKAIAQFIDFDLFTKDKELAFKETRPLRDTNTGIITGTRVEVMSWKDQTEYAPNKDGNISSNLYNNFVVKVHKKISILKSTILLNLAMLLLKFTASATTNRPLKQRMVSSFVKVLCQKITLLIRLLKLKIGQRKLPIKTVQKMMPRRHENQSLTTFWSPVIKIDCCHFNLFSHFLVIGFCALLFLHNSQDRFFDFSDMKRILDDFTGIFAAIGTVCAESAFWFYYF